MGFMWKLLNLKSFTQIFKMIFFILLQRSVKQSEYEFSTFGEVSAQIEEIKLLCLISSCFGSSLLPQAGTTLFSWFSGRNSGNKNMKWAPPTIFQLPKKLKSKFFTLLWNFTVGKLRCLLKAASEEMLFLSGLNNYLTEQESRRFWFSIKFFSSDLEAFLKYDASEMLFVLRR